jgi:hypothetical protein
MCFLYQDIEDNKMLQWYQGLDMKILSDKSKDKSILLFQLNEMMSL